MRSLPRLPRADRPVAAAAGRVLLVAFALSTLTRLVIATRLETTDWTRDPLGFAAAFAAGAVADAGVAALLAAAAWLLLALCARRGLRTLAHLLLAGGMVALVFTAVAEVFFWDEFASRLNGIAVFYLIFPREVIGNLRESFDLGLYLPPIVAVGLMLWAWSRRSFNAALGAGTGRHRLLRGAGAVLLLAGAGGLLLAAAPRRIGANRELGQLARNGPANMVAAALTNDSEYDGVYPGIDESRALPVLRRIVAQDNTTFVDPPGTRSIRRWVDNGTRPERLNVVMVIEESFGSRFVDVLDNTLEQRITPYLDRLSQQGLFFTNVYASGQRSVRGLEAVLTSFTPIPGISTARRPGSAGMYSLPGLLRRFGYETAMLYAGRALFDNMGTFWRGIGFDHVWDQNDIRHQSFTTAWGVSDEDLFAEGLDRIDAVASRARPFLLTMFTVSNHRPYRFPQTHVKWDPSLGGRENTARYADWAYADFLDQARARPWFDDTVFVFVADHGHRVNGAAEVPLHRYRIPMLFYSPRHIAPRKVDTLAAQIDLIPTLLGRLGLSYESNFFGIDLLRVPPGGGRIAVAHDFSIAFARPGDAVVLEPDGREIGYRFTPGYPVLVPEPPDPTVSVMARSVTQTAHRMFYAGQYRDSGPRQRGDVAYAR